VIDVAPTVLEVVGAAAPTVYRGIAQLPIHGVSMAYTFDARDAPTMKRVQHFEMLGDRALWCDGWEAVARHTKGEDFDADRWELYHLDEDFSECRDLAAAQPQKLRELVEPRRRVERGPRRWRLRLGSTMAPTHSDPPRCISWGRVLVVERSRGDGSRCAVIA
jgi:arylsulfatase A-like enzyme